VTIRHLVPPAIRHAVARLAADRRASRIEQELEALARDARPIVAGPFLGEVGFELLYWVPFLAWCAERFQVDPERLIVISRGGTAAWYAGFANRYADAFDSTTPEAFRA